jgi:hypothetical protein
MGKKFLFTETIQSEPVINKKLKCHAPPSRRADAMMSILKEHYHKIVLQIDILKIVFIKILQ